MSLDGFAWLFLGYIPTHWPEYPCLHAYTHLFSLSLSILFTGLPHRSMNITRHPRSLAPPHITPQWHWTHYTIPHCYILHPSCFFLVWLPKKLKDQMGDQRNYTISWHIGLSIHACMHTHIFPSSPYSLQHAPLFDVHHMTSGLLLHLLHLTPLLNGIELIWSFVIWPFLHPPSLLLSPHMTTSKTERPIKSYMLLIEQWGSLERVRKEGSRWAYVQVWILRAIVKTTKWIVFKTTSKSYLYNF